MGRTVTLAHSPDTDDAFMFHALAAGKIDSRGMEFRHVLEDIQTLNLRAEEGLYDVTAISFRAWPVARHHYLLATAGSSVGDGYGPIVVSKSPLTRQDLPRVTIGIPGTLTTAYLVLKLFCPEAKTTVIPFDRIPDEVAKGTVDAGLVIHEGQLTYGDLNLNRIVDLGEWWRLGTGLPLPLGGNAIRRSLDPQARRDIDAVIRDSVAFALAHRAEALEHALSYGRGLDRERADRFVGMYVNDFTLDLGKSGQDSLRLLLQLGHEAGLIPERVEPEFVS
jgi:1,4-dihydroxy-6-naphthoate synthase